MSTISAVIITKNEESNIERCLNSVRWADEIVVIDTGSEDRTVEIAGRFRTIVFEIEWQGFGHAKAYGVDRASGDWILSVDADEVISASLAGEIQRSISANNASAGFLIPRKTNFLGRWIIHSRWSPDYVLRLFRNGKGNFTESLVHEKIIVNGPTARLCNPILHYSYPDVKTYFAKSKIYAALGAEEMRKKGKRYGLSGMLLKAVAAFYRHYVMGAGFLDGIEGFLIAVSSASGTVRKYRCLRSLEKAESK